MGTQLFRQEAIEAGRHRLVGEVLAAAPPGSNVYTATAAAVALAMLALLCFGSYAAHERVRGVVAYDRGVARVYPPTAAEIRQIHVHSGQQVTRGQPLLTISLNPGRDASGEGMAGQLAQIAQQDAELFRQLKLAGELAFSTEASLREQRGNAAAGLASLERQRAIGFGQLELARRDSARTERIAEQGAGSRRQVEERRGVLLARRAELEQLAEKIITQRETVRALDTEIARTRLEAARTRSEIAGRRSALAENRMALVRQDHLIVVAPVAGQVGEIVADIGQRARPDSSLVTIIPTGSTLEAWLYAPSRAVGFVRPGSEVQLLFDAFPYQKFGAVRGRVREVSQVATDPATLDPGLGIQEPVFRVRVVGEGKTLRPPAAAGGLRQGMTLSANIVLHRRRLWELLFDPILSATRG